MITLDRIVTSVLLRKKYPIHWYLECLKHAADCLRELHFDTLGNIKAIQLTVNDYRAVKLPCDYVDFVKVGLPNGQFVRPIVQRNGLNRLNNTDSEGNNIPHTQGDTDQYVYGANLVWFNNVNTNGENIGRLPGHNVDSQIDTFKVLPERGEIQLDERLMAESIILEYISDGQSADNATKVHPYAQACIEAYILWQLKACSRSYNMGEVQSAKIEYLEALKNLRSRMSGITLEDIKRSIRKGNNIA